MIQNTKAKTLYKTTVFQGQSLIVTLWMDVLYDVPVNR